MPPSTILPHNPGTSSGVITLHDVGKTYETASGPFHALRHVGFSVNAGDMLGVVGKSGCGKSTLLNVMTGIDRPTTGEIHVAGSAVHALDETRLAAWRGRNVGVVFQFFQLLPTLTVAENVVLPMEFSALIPRPRRRERALMLLERMGIADQADKLPLSLSGGQQQRAAIARALANDPPLLVADEPTGNLDSRTSEGVWNLFSSLAKEGKTVIVVTHDPDVARWMSRVITLADGAVQSDSAAVNGTRNARVAHA